MIGGVHTVGSLSPRTSVRFWLVKAIGHWVSFTLWDTPWDLHCRRHSCLVAVVPSWIRRGLGAWGSSDCPAACGDERTCLPITHSWLEGRVCVCVCTWVCDARSAVLIGSWASQWYADAACQISFPLMYTELQVITPAGMTQAATAQEKKHTLWHGGMDSHAQNIPQICLFWLPVIYLIYIQYVISGADVCVLSVWE